MRVYAPVIKDQIGGGFTFLTNLKEALMHKVHFVSTWQECDIFFISGITMTDKNELYEAKKAGKKIVLRVDNVPRKSRNKRSSPAERLKEFAEMSDVVIYQSKWAKDYCYPLCGEGAVIYNGVNQKVFKPDESEDPIEKNHRYLFMYHGKNELKQFWVAHYIFQMICRKNPEAVFWFINDFGRDLEELEASNFDFWNGEVYMHMPKVQTREEVIELMQQCGHLIYPAVADASPNLVLEARACGLDILYPSPPDMSGTEELMLLEDISVERMAEEYYGVFDLLLSESNV